MNWLKRLIVCLCFSLPISVWAHGYWIELEGDHKINHAATIRLFFGEYVSGERLSGNFLDRMKDIKVYVLDPTGSKEIVTMKQHDGFWQGSFTPAKEGEYKIWGINDERDVQDWTKHNLGIVRPIQYLKAVYQVGKLNSKSSLSSFLDIKLKKTKGDSCELQVTRNDSAFASAKVVITHPSGWEKTVITDKNGKAVFKTVGQALYLVSLEWIDKTPGIFKHKPYETVRHQFDYSLYDK